jgi:hypothetical protein
MKFDGTFIASAKSACQAKAKKFFLDCRAALQKTSRAMRHNCTQTEEVKRGAAIK